MELSALLGGSGATDLKNAWAFFYAPQGITSSCGEKSLQHTSDDMVESTLMSMFAQCMHEGLVMRLMICLGCTNHC